MADRHSFRIESSPCFGIFGENRLLAVGMGALTALILTVTISYMFYSQENLSGEPTGVSEMSKELSAFPEIRPSWNPWGEFPLGTDPQGRDIYAGLMVGAPLTLRVGLIAAGNRCWCWFDFGVCSSLRGWLGRFCNPGLSSTSLIPIPGLLIVVLVATAVKSREGYLCRPNGLRYIRARMARDRQE